MLIYAALCMYASFFSKEQKNNLRADHKCLKWHCENSSEAAFVKFGGNPQMCESANTKPTGMGGQVL